MSDSEQGYNIWGVVASVLGTLGLLSIIWDLLESQMPTKRLRQLEADLKTTYDMLNENIEEGLLDPERFRPRMRIIKHRIDDLRARVYAATTWQEEVRNWKRGLSAQVDVLFGEVYKIRATIAKSSSEERKKLGGSDVENNELVVLPDQALDCVDIAVPLVEQALPDSTSTTSLTDVPQGSPSPCFDGCDSPPQQSSSTSSTSTALSRTDDSLDKRHDSKTFPCEVPENGADAEVRPSRALDRPRDQKAWRKRPPSRRDVLLQFGRQLMKPSLMRPRTPSLDVLPSTMPRPSRKQDVLRMDSCGDGARFQAKRWRVTLVELPAPYPELCDEYEGDDESD